MATIHRGATLTPRFRDFLPAWVARQPWYRGVGTPTLSPIGYFRFEDPAGQVGIETHLVTDGAALYQVPMTYRGAPLEDSAPDALITTRLLERGAGRPEYQPNEERWLVLTDPAGHPFCLAASG